MKRRNNWSFVSENLKKVFLYSATCAAAIDKGREIEEAPRILKGERPLCGPPLFFPLFPVKRSLSFSLSLSLSLFLSLSLLSLMGRLGERPPKRGLKLDIGRCPPRPPLPSPPAADGQTRQSRTRRKEGAWQSERNEVAEIPQKHSDVKLDITEQPSVTLVLIHQQALVVVP